MLNAYLVKDGQIFVTSVSGLTPVELKRMTDVGWVTFWSTDREAFSKGMALGREAMRASKRARV